MLRPIFEQEGFRGVTNFTNFEPFWCFTADPFLPTPTDWVRIFSTRGMSAVGKKNHGNGCHHFRILVVPFGLKEKPSLLLKKKLVNQALEKWVDWTSRENTPNMYQVQRAPSGLSDKPKVRQVGDFGRIGQS